MIALIMILSVVGIGSFTLATVKSKDTQRKNDLNQVVKALESFNNDVGRYPLSTDTEKVVHCYVNQSGVVSNPKCDSNKLYSVIDGAMTIYITFPSDPDPAQKYVYISTDGADYSLYAALENTADKDLLRDANGIVNLNPWSVSCGGVSCNYKVTETGLVKNL